MDYETGVDLVLLAVAAMSLRSTLRLLVVPSSASLYACLRWRSLASYTAAIGCCLQGALAIEPTMLLVVVTAAVDCWLVTLDVPRSLIPRAIVRGSTLARLWGLR